MYKGYLKSKGKRTITKFKENSDVLLNYKQARSFKSFVGVLDDDYIMIDVDDISLKMNRFIVTYYLQTKECIFILKVIT